MPRPRFAASFTCPLCERCCCSCNCFSCCCCLCRGLGGYCCSSVAVVAVVVALPSVVVAGVVNFSAFRLNAHLRRFTFFARMSACLSRLTKSLRRRSYLGKEGSPTINTSLLCRSLFSIACCQGSCRGPEDNAVGGFPGGNRAGRRDGHRGRHLRGGSSPACQDRVHGLLRRPTRGVRTCAFVCPLISFSAVLFPNSLFRASSYPSFLHTAVGAVAGELTANDLCLRHFCVGVRGD